MDTSVSDDNQGALHHRIFHSSYFDYRHAFRTVLVSFWYVGGEHSCQRMVMDTSLSDIIEARTTITIL